MRTTAAGEDQPAIGVAAWVSQLQSPAPEPVRSRRMAHIGGIAAITALLAYLVETMSLWVFHTPDGAVRTLPPGVPPIAARPVR